MIEKIKNDFLSIWKRFPISLSFATAITAYLLYCIFVSIEPGFLLLYLVLGLLTSYLLHLVTEDFESPRGKRSILLWVISHALLIADYVWLEWWCDSSLPTSVGYMQVSILACLCVAIFTLPFFKEKDDNKTLNFAGNLIIAGMVSLLVATLTFISCQLLIYGTCSLFDFYPKHDTDVLCVLCFWFLLIVVFHSKTPQGLKKHNSVLNGNRFISGLSHYLILPVMCMYFVVLYVYLGKIVIEWQLPDGWVSLLVTALMSLVFLLELLLYPSVNNNGGKDNKWDARIIRIIPWLTLPLLALMSVGIVRRFMDYGLTAPRLYIATVNIWFYVMAFLLATGRMKRLTLIPVSFVALFLLTSAQPFSYSEIAKHCHAQQVKQIMEKYEMKAIDIKDDSFEWLKNLSQDDAEQLASSIKYLEDNNFYATLTAAVCAGKEYSKETYYSYSLREAVEKRRASEWNYIYVCNSDENIPVSEGFTYVRYIFNGYQVSCDAAHINITVKDKYLFSLPRKNLPQANADGSNPPLVLTSKDGEAQLVVISLDVKEGEVWNGLSGYLFYK